ncbi:MAG: lysophospholipid acyltransferase family protein [Elusimicrobia bacterium]|nr:lysophospholipid acyltransferase family protein [Elusimicrobiota bacterium]
MVDQKREEAARRQRVSSLPLLRESPTPMPAWDRFLINLAARLLWLYTIFVAKTSTVRWLRREPEEKLRAMGQGAIYTFWHNRQAMLLYLHQKKPIAVLISASKDGEMGAQIAENFELSSVRGSSRKRSSEGLRALIRCVRQGYSIAVAPDGPLGPPREVKQGVLYLSQSLGVPILPVTVAYSQKIVFKTWDAFMFPLPFGKIAAGYGEPIWIKKEDNLEAKAIEVKEALDQISADVDAAIQ